MRFLALRPERMQSILPPDGYIMRGMSYTAGQAEKATGVPYNQLNYWAKTGILAPSVTKARGSNKCRATPFST
jgi:hypothetical protein